MAALVPSGTPFHPMVYPDGLLSHAQELHQALVAVALDMWSDRSSGSAAGKTGQGQRIARGAPKCRRLLFCCPAFNNRGQFARPAHSSVACYRQHSLV